MTCIVGVIDNGSVFIGGDSATTWGDDAEKLIVASNPKVFRVGPVLIGYCGSGRVGRLLQYSLIPPPVRKLPVDKYISTVFVDAVRRCLEVGGVLVKKNNVEEIPTDFLVGYRGRIWRIDGDFNVDESRHSYDAVGCGSPVALGALHATQSAPAKQRVMAALRAAQEFSAAVRGPFTVLELASK